MPSERELTEDIMLPIILSVPQSMASLWPVIYMLIKKKTKTLQAGHGGALL